MSAPNRHVIVVSGQTLREIAENSAQIFDAFFDRDCEWNVISIDTERINVIATGAGEEVAWEWNARVEAEAVGISIGASRHERVLWFGKL